jgi:dienelactone hydrolase
MFNDHTARPDPLTLHGQVMGGLKYLATLKNVNRQKISVMGMSLGAMLTIHAGSTWFYDTFQAEDLRFNKLVALYPVCWIMSEVSKGQMQGLPSYAGLPSTFLQKWVGAPLLILAAGKDSYDGSNPDACPTFVRGIADVQQSKMTTVEVYKHATHGWDHGKSYSFPIRGGCVGRSDCTNHITYNREIVEAGKQAALSFLNDQ